MGQAHLGSLVGDAAAFRRYKAMYRSSPQHAAATKPKRPKSRLTSPATLHLHIARSCSGHQCERHTANSRAPTSATRKRLAAGRGRGPEWTCYSALPSPTPSTPDPALTSPAAWSYSGHQLERRAVNSRALRTQRCHEALQLCHSTSCHCDGHVLGAAAPDPVSRRTRPEDTRPTFGDVSDLPT